MNNKKHIKSSFTKSISLIKQHMKNMYDTPVLPTNDTSSYEQPINTIYINKDLNIKEKFYILIHESGHAIQYHQPYYVELYPRASKCNTRDPCITKASRIDIVREEVDAWNIGLDLIFNTLMLTINMQEFSEHSRRYLWTYIDWCVDHTKKEYKPFRERSLKRRATANMIMTL